MAKFNYARSVATANRLIDKFGQTGAIRRTETSGDPWNPGTSDTDYPCTLVALDYDQKDVDGTLIKSTDKKVYVAIKGLAIQPTTTDKVIIGGVVSTIVEAKPLNPAGIIVLFEFQIRS
ncbi:hypothetical protein JQC79_19360 [Ochrobactrum anthropi]|uniref:Uncharacterized protein n=1 Tax=Brucella anthropi TaxID=529 RepID=A0A8I0TAV5_BRUAN|nr:hypothetical protein [Brucella anthropi]MBE0563577.1 hypothetical protein [Brucella anthropi]MBM6397913.1 hypothetical protein [Brucella anthropi]